MAAQHLRFYSFISSFKGFFFCFLTVAVARQGATCKMQSIDKIRFGQALRSWPQNANEGRKNYGSSAGYGRDFKSHYCLCLCTGAGVMAGVKGARAPFDLWHICYKVNTKRSHTASNAFQWDSKCRFLFSDLTRNFT